MKTKNTFLFLVLSILTATFVSAASYMKLGDIKGEARDNAHDGWIEILSVNGLNNANQSATDRKSNPHQDLVLVRELDKSSTKLAEACTTGTNVGNVTISRGANTYVVKDATVASYSKKGNKETITLRYNEVTMKPIRLEVKGGANHNTTRSNKTQAVASPDSVSESTSKAADYNSSRSNNES